MKDKQVECFAWADDKEVEKREEAISKYYRVETEREIVRRSFKSKRGGRKAKDILKEKFLDLYNKGLYDKEIAEILYVGKSVVTIYRNDLKLPVNKKSLLAQANKKIKSTATL